MKEEAEKEAEKAVEKQAEEDAAVNEDDTAEIRFNINGYNTLFSDFDARPLAQRGLSEDFLGEARRAVAARPADKFNFVFLIPRSKRKVKDEAAIKDRLKKHFKKHFNMLEGDKNKVLRKGISFTISGVLLMFLATYLLFRFQSQDIFTSFLTVLLEPAGWFLFWEGLDLIIFESKKPNPNIDFNKKMSEAKMEFVSE